MLVTGPGIEPTSPALQDRFLTTRPPGKSPLSRFTDFFSSTFWVAFLGLTVKSSTFTFYPKRIERNFFPHEE